MKSIIDHIFASGKFSRIGSDHDDFAQLLSMLDVDIADAGHGFEFVRSADKKHLFLSNLVWRGSLDKNDQKHLQGCSHASVSFVVRVSQEVLHQLRTAELTLPRAMHRCALYVVIASADYTDTMREFMTIFTGNVHDIPKDFRPDVTAFIPSEKDTLLWKTAQTAVL